MRRDHPSNIGFTLIEFLIAFGFAAIAVVPILGLMRNSLRLVHASSEMAVVAQAAQSPELGEKALGARVRTVGTEQIEIGPIRITGVEIEIIPRGRTEGIRVKVYK